MLTADCVVTCGRGYWWLSYFEKLIFKLTNIVLLVVMCAFFVLLKFCYNLIAPINIFNSYAANVQNMMISKNEREWQMGMNSALNP